MAAQYIMIATLINQLREWFNQNFPRKWIGRNSPLCEFPPRSPDITPLDFYLWVHLKKKCIKADHTQDKNCVTEFLKFVDQYLLKN